jgi:hypothetical protein
MTPVANLPPVSTTPVADLPLVSTTPSANFATGNAGIVDTIQVADLPPCQRYRRHCPFF